MKLRACDSRESYEDSGSRMPNSMYLQLVQVVREVGIGQLFNVDHLSDILHMAFHMDVANFRGPDFSYLFLTIKEREDER